MIGELPEYVCIDKKKYLINTNFKNIINILAAFENDNLNEFQKMEILIKNFYTVEFINKIPVSVEKAVEKAFSFISQNKTVKKNKYVTIDSVIDWEEDEQYIFDAITSFCKYDIRTAKTHYYTFLSYLKNIQNTEFNKILQIRQKLIDQIVKPYQYYNLTTEEKKIIKENLKFTIDEKIYFYENEEVIYTKKFRKAFEELKKYYYGGDVDGRRVIII